MTTLFTIAVTIFVGSMILEWFIKQWLQKNAPDFTQQHDPAISLTGLEVLRQFVPPGVTIQETSHCTARGATYYHRSRRLVVARRNFDRADGDTVWRAYHELRHPQQTGRLWQRLHTLKILGESGYGLSLAVDLQTQGTKWFLWNKIGPECAIILFVLASLSYFFGDLLPEWDAVMTTPLIGQQCGLEIVTDQQNLEAIQTYLWSHMLLYLFTTMRMICTGALILYLLPRLLI